MRIGVITGTGTYALPGLGDGAPERVETRFGEALVTRGPLGDVEMLHVSRHGEGHVRLSNHVTHRANVAALKELGAEAVIAVTVCGAVDPSLALGSLVVFDDLHFLGNRLATDRSALSTTLRATGAAVTGSTRTRSRPACAPRCSKAALPAGIPARDGGCYGHVDGPRFNTRAEIRSLALAGVTAVSQTAGPETVLCGEAELPYALLGYATDYANGVHGRGHAGGGAAATDRGQHRGLRDGARGRGAEARGSGPPAAGRGLPLRGLTYGFS